MRRRIGNGEKTNLGKVNKLSAAQRRTLFIFTARNLLIQAWQLAMQQPSLNIPSSLQPYAMLVHRGQKQQASNMLKSFLLKSLISVSCSEKKYRKNISYIMVNNNLNKCLLCFWALNRWRESVELSGSERWIMQINTKNSIRQFCMHTSRACSLSRHSKCVRWFAQLEIFSVLLQVECLTFSRSAYLPQLTNGWKHQLFSFEDFITIRLNAIYLVFSSDCAPMRPLAVQNDR